MSDCNLEKDWFVKNNIDLEFLGWKHPYFREFENKLEEENNFIENPILDVQDGVHHCEKCGSSQTFSYSKQIRSSDEGETVFVTCIQCNTNWVNDG